jgi:hypothetical protein
VSIKPFNAFILPSYVTFFSPLPRYLPSLGTLAPVVYRLFTWMPTMVITLAGDTDTRNAPLSMTDLLLPMINVLIDPGPTLLAIAQIKSPTRANHENIDLLNLSLSPWSPPQRKKRNSTFLSYSSAFIDTLFLAEPPLAVTNCPGLPLAMTICPSPITMTHGHLLIA